MFVGVLVGLGVFVGVFDSPGTDGGGDDGGGEGLSGSKQSIKHGQPTIKFQLKFLSLLHIGLNTSTYAIILLIRSVLFE